VKIGYSYSSDEGAALAAFGSSASAAQTFANYQADLQNELNRVAQWVDAHGGLGGCPMQVTLHDFHILGSDGFTGETQTECTDFAQDQHVFAAISVEEETGALIPCLAKAGVVSIFDSPVYAPSPSDFSQYHGYLYQPDEITIYRWGPFISLLASSGYFGSNAKVGILLADDGTGHNQYLVNNLWKPALAKMGINPVVFTFTEGDGSQASLSGEETQFDSAVLQFKTAGVNHVIMTPDGGNGVFLFPPAAQAQGFAPRYALTDANGAAAWGVATPQQQAGAMAISWSNGDTAVETTQTQMNTNPKNSTQTECKQIFAGFPLPSGQSVTALYPLCDRFLFLYYALKNAKSPTTQSLLAGVDALGSSYPLASGYGNAHFGPADHYDGAQYVRVMGWSSADKQWEYVGPPVSIPLS
jgi:hypothetical protein